MTDAPSTAVARLRQEFDRWAEDGRGEEMEAHHLPIVLPMLERMQLSERERWLDLGCGAGWLCRLLARRFPQSEFTGVDISEAMVERARGAAAGLANVQFLAGGAERIPAPAGAFSRVVSVESAYYWPEPERALEEIRRVLEPGGTAWILINYYRDNPHAHRWSEHLPMPVRWLYAAEWMRMLSAAGLADVEAERIPDLSPTPPVYAGRWFAGAEELRRFKAVGALLLRGRRTQE